jgi:AGZA family xanthine/uracil permease-like MFS transporter
VTTATSLRSELSRRAPEPVAQVGRERFDKADREGAVALTLDLVAQLLVLDTLLRFVVGVHDHLVMTRILPGLGLALLLGNAASAGLARSRARERGEDEAVAMGVGLDMGALFLFCFLVVLPMRIAMDSSYPAWQVGMGAAVIAGLGQCLAIFLPDQVRAELAGSAVLSPAGALAFLFLALPAAFGTYTLATGLLAVLALVCLWLVAQVRLDAGVPAGLLVLVACAGAAWLIGMNGAPPRVALLGVNLPGPVPEAVFGAGAFLGSPAWAVVAMGAALFGVASTSRQLAAARDGGGDTSDMTGHVVLGASTLLGAFCGSIVPVAYVDNSVHDPATGARARHVVPVLVLLFALCMTGALAVIVRLLPTEAALAVVVWLGLVSTVRGMNLVGDADAPGPTTRDALVTRERRPRPATPATTEAPRDDVAATAWPSAK